MIELVEWLAEGVKVLVEFADLVSEPKSATRGKKASERISDPHPDSIKYWVQPNSTADPIRSRPKHHQDP